MAAIRPLVQERTGIVEMFAVLPGQAHQDPRPAIRRLAGQAIAGRAAGVLEGWIEDEILTRIAREEELRKHHEVGAETGGLLPGVPGPRLVPVNVADNRIQLRQGDLERGPDHGSGM